MFWRKKKAITESGPYTFGATPTGLGIGAENQAFGRPYMPVESGQYGPRYNIRGDLGPFTGGGIIVKQSLPSVSLRGNGLYFAGAFGATPLSGNDPGNG